MRPISRRALAAAAVACFASAFALTPAEVRSRLGPPPAARPDTTLAPETTPRLVHPNGDPFVPRFVESDTSTQPLPALPVPPALARIGPLPANAGAGLMPLALASGLTPHVTAIVLGARPTALIIDGSTPHIVGVGDRVGGGTITAVDAGGVRLSDGSRLALPSPESTH